MLSKAKVSSISERLTAEEKLSISGCFTTRPSRSDTIDTVPSDEDSTSYPNFKKEDAEVETEDIIEKKELLRTVLSFVSNKNWRQLRRFLPKLNKSFNDDKIFDDAKHCSLLHKVCHHRPPLLL
jgi:hypothetical protein